jgi:hypothetical protein
MTTEHCENRFRFFSQWCGKMLPESEPFKLVNEMMEKLDKKAGKKPHSSQTAVDSFFSYLYYSTQTEIFATEMGHLKRNGKPFS